MPSRITESHEEGLYRAPSQRKPQREHYNEEKSDDDRQDKVDCQEEFPKTTLPAHQLEGNYTSSISDNLQNSAEMATEAEEEEEDGLLFSCRCESARSVSTLLSCLRHVSLSNSSGFSSTTGHDTSTFSAAPSTFSAIPERGGRSGGRNKAQHATVYVTPTALTFHVHGVGNQSQASVDMHAGLFSDYYVAERTIPILEDESDGDDNNQTSTSQHTKNQVVQGGEFGINLTTVLECLHVLGPASLDRTKICLSYDYLACILKIELLEESSYVGADLGSGGLVLVNSAIPGMAVPDDEGEGTSSLAVAFRSSPIVARAITKSDYLKDAIAELTDVAGAASATIGLSPSGLELAAVGHSSECNISLPFTGNHPQVFVFLECNPKILHARKFPLHSLLSAMRGLEIASETCISINKEGMIAIQHQVLDVVGNGQPNFVDSIMGCLIEDDDDEDPGEKVMQDKEVESGNTTQGSNSFKEIDRNHRDIENEPQLKRNEVTSKQNSSTRTSFEAFDAELQRNDSGSDSEQDKSEEKSATTSNLFGAVAEIGATSTQKNVKRRSRKGRYSGKELLNKNKASAKKSVESLSNDDKSNHSLEDSEKSAAAKPPDHILSEDSDDGNDSEEEPDDVDFSTFSKRRTSGRARIGAPSSPQLMYGDTHLEASDDEDKEIGKRRYNFRRYPRTNRSSHTNSFMRSDDETDEAEF